MNGVIHDTRSHEETTSTGHCGSFRADCGAYSSRRRTTHCTRSLDRWSHHAVIKGEDAHNRGQGMIEYGLIIALVAVVVIATLVLLGPAIARLLQGVITAL